ncbi:hypothetical protein DCAR_0314265 [Daucus carota subsp. sativus]|uniref:Uncharacterized protein n=1 Tax=Daucus carota subsp. sativus TaxID=79200 RepID=A0AAF0WV04_DAUCS|nr:hypothetical protein DCAR_0314265 [Daucus carota subsp. sativus]
MTLETSHGELAGIGMESRNSGATMVARRSSSSDDSGDYQCININVNNNVQGINNSIFVGSKVNIGDSGVWLALKDVKVGTRETSELGYFCIAIIVVAMIAFLWSF